MPLVALVTLPMEDVVVRGQGSGGRGLGLHVHIQLAYLAESIWPKHMIVKLQTKAGNFVPIVGRGDKPGLVASLLRGGRFHEQIVTSRAVGGVVGLGSCVRCGCTAAGSSPVKLIRSVVVPAAVIGVLEITSVAHALYTRRRWEIPAGSITVDFFCSRPPESRPTAEPDQAAPELLDHRQLGIIRECWTTPAVDADRRLLTPLIGGQAYGELWSHPREETVTAVVDHLSSGAVTCSSILQSHGRTTIGEHGRQIQESEHK